MQIQKIKNYKETYEKIIKKFELYQNFENIRFEQFTFKNNNNLVKSNISKKSLNH